MTMLVVLRPRRTPPDGIVMRARRGTGASFGVHGPDDAPWDRQSVLGPPYIETAAAVWSGFNRAAQIPR
jgi:hypothetical protein